MNENTYQEMANLLKKTFSIALKQKRAEYGYSREETEEKCCISNKQIYNIEYGKSLPRLTTLENLAIVFNLDLNAILKTLIEKGYVITPKDDK